MNNIVILKDNKDMRLYLLSVLNKVVDNEGFVVDNDTDHPVLTIQGNELRYKDFGGIIENNGKILYFDNDILTFVKSLEFLYETEEELR